MTAAWFSLWWPAFLSTLLTEVPIDALFLERRLGLADALALGVALQCITHPLFWSAWGLAPAFFYDHYGAAVLGFEAVVYLVEAALIWLALPRRNASQRLPNPVLALLTSAFANTASVLIGLLSSVSSS